MLLWSNVSSFAQTVTVQWEKVQSVNKTIPTLQIPVSPALRPGSSVAKRAYAEVTRLGVDYARYMPWMPFPKLSVAELEPPGDGKTSWDFSLIDPMMEDFLKATTGHPVIVNFSTTPQWMWVTPQPVPYPRDPNEVTWTYTQGTELRDPSCGELADYYGRLAGWYVNGGFTDEYGKRHESGHHFDITYWEILNEPDFFSHIMSPEEYTRCYDSITTEIKKVAPKAKFVGLVLAQPSDNPRMFEYFLNPANHKAGVPLDMIAYHFIAVPTADQTPEIKQFTFFEQADGFVTTARYIEEIRKRLSPTTRIAVDEIGAFLVEDLEPGRVTGPVPDSHWSLAGAVYAYVFGRLAALGIDVANEVGLVWYPAHFAGLSMVDWNTGAPNARFRVLELLKGSFHPGDKLVNTAIDTPLVYALGYVGQTGDHKLLLVNKRDHPIEVSLPESAKKVEFVDQTTKSDPPVKRTVNNSKYMLGGYGVAVLSF